MQRGQVSLEFLLIMSVALFILAASTFAVFRYSNSQSAQSAMFQVARIGYEIVEQAANVYTYGSGSLVTVSAQLPEDVSSVAVLEPNILEFNITTSVGVAPVYVFSPINFFNDSSASDVVLLSDVSGVSVNFRVNSIGSWVNVSVS